MNEWVIANIGWLIACWFIGAIVYVILKLFEVSFVIDDIKEKSITEFFVYALTWPIWFVLSTVKFVYQRIIREMKEF